MDDLIPIIFIVLIVGGLGLFFYFLSEAADKDSVCNVACIEAKHSQGTEMGGSCRCADYTIIAYPAKKE